MTQSTDSGRKGDMGSNERAAPYRLILDDDSVWPRADRTAALEHSLRYSEPSRKDLLEAAEVLAAYIHLLTHAAGTESAVRKLRSLRRAAAKE